MLIKTQYTTTKSGAGRIVAKGGSKQVTLPYDHAASVRENHRNAAQTLALRLDTNLFPHTECISTDSGSAVFTL